MGRAVSNSDFTKFLDLTLNGNFSDPIFFLLLDVMT